MATIDTVQEQLFRADETLFEIGDKLLERPIQDVRTFCDSLFYHGNNSLNGLWIKKSALRFALADFAAWQCPPACVLLLL
jgi:hypothetical protein